MNKNNGIFLQMAMLMGSMEMQNKTNTHQQLNPI